MRYGGYAIRSLRRFLDVLFELFRFRVLRAPLFAPPLTLAVADRLAGHLCAAALLLLIHVTFSLQLFR